MRVYRHSIPIPSPESPCPVNRSPSPLVSFSPPEPALRAHACSATRRQSRRRRVRVWRRPLDRAARRRSARRLTATPDVETEPHFSPDGSLIAFTRTSTATPTSTSCRPPAASRSDSPSIPGRIACAAGRPTASGSSLLGPRERAAVLVSPALDGAADGGFEEPLPMPRAFTGTYSPDGTALRVRRDLDGVHSRLVRDELVAPLSRRPHAPDPHHRLRRLLRRKSAVEEQQRPRSDVDRQHRLLPLRPHLHDEPVLVRPRDEEAQAAHAPRRLRHHERVRRTPTPSSTSRRATSISST